ncbi:MAG: hypothetical protein HZA93_24075 [Verrucomicrobia bacterium]|nr:hypothetical protein [Verrucomicrobiota bacterium]
MPTVSQALLAFREAHAAMLIAAEAVSAAVEAEAGELGTVPADLALIMDRVAARYGFRRPNLIAHRREAPIALARHVAMQLARELTDHSIETIGHAFARHHGTICHATAATLARADTEPAFRAELDQLRREIYAELSDAAPV